MTPLGDHALQLTFPDETVDLQLYVDQLCNLSLPGVSDIVPTYAAIAIVYDPLIWDYGVIRKQIAEQLTYTSISTPPPTSIIEIPVCYDPVFGPDLERLAVHHQLTTEEVITMHSMPVYRVQFIGFAPGFPYLSDVHPKIATPRHQTPRFTVSAGSVGIAGKQTGIYPFTSPGGWQIIGRTPIPLFDPFRPEPSFLHAGDHIRFIPISASQFQSWK
ncbi:5-oxoprolinase subunit PxpB [Hazenella sp. IB182353]|nr:5-oxoprolinase subunit PxpB [Polycladospora coralii]